jgi:uncharacterized protein YyaL (SSP411 family)
MHTQVNASPAKPWLQWALAALTLTAALLFTGGVRAAETGVGPKWQTWSDQAFADAKRDNRFVILYLEAVWCHWCHVMDKETYSNPEVNKLIAEHYVPVRIDQDAFPDLSRRYENYGWPATIVFNANGEEIVKLRGYKPPLQMASILQGIVDDPSPIVYRDSVVPTTFAQTAALEPKLAADLLKRYRNSQDYKQGGLDQEQKYLDRDTIEYSLMLAGQDDKVAEHIARSSLDGAIKLIDPVWGGMYQYSEGGVWNKPHFEKIMQIQADALRLYGLAYGQFKDPRYLKAANNIYRYMKNFLRSPEGAFYVSQDADLVKGQHGGSYFSLSDKERRKRGMPAIDKHMYARENGWMIMALTTLYDKTGDQKYLDDAITTARWVMANRDLPNGGFRHDVKDKNGPFLEDTLTMGRAFLALHTSTGDRVWLTRARSAADFILANFRSESPPGFLSSSQAQHGVLKLQPLVDENVAMARFVHSLAEYTGDKRYSDAAQLAMRYLATREVLVVRRSEPGVLQVAEEMATAPTHFTIVGGKSDPAALSLYRAALAYPMINRRIEWWDRSEGPLPNSEVEYPQLTKAAAFVCTDNTCSLPIFDAAKVGEFAAEFAATTASN